MDGSAYGSMTPGSPFTSGPSPAIPLAAALAGRIRGPFVVEDRLDGRPEQARDREGERKAGVELARFDRVDGLTRHLQPLSQIGLGPIALGPEHFEPILHR